MTTAPPVVHNPRAAWLARFESVPRRGEPPALSRLRREALERFAAEGFPAPRAEAWRHTPVADVAGRPWAVAGATLPSAEALAPHRVDVPGATRLVFVDGRFAPALSDAAPGGGLRVERLREALAREDVAERFASLRGPAGGPFPALSTALFEDGLCLTLLPGAGEPPVVDVLHLSTARGTPAAVFPRVLVLAGEGSRGTIVERHESLGEAAWLTLPVTQVDVGPGAVVEHVVWPAGTDASLHVGSTHVRVGRDGRYAAWSLTSGGGLERSETAVRLDAPGASCELSGLYVLAGERHADQRTLVDHAAPHGTSRELYKGVLDGRATSSFLGAVVVRADAQKTDARQANHNLLLSPDAVAHTKPQLEIFADDVKCAHGATVGPIDADALFYLRSRGIEPATARDLLVHAFSHEVTDALPVPALRERAAAGLADRAVGGTP